MLLSFLGLPLDLVHLATVELLHWDPQVPRRGADAVPEDRVQLGGPSIVGPFTDAGDLVDDVERLGPGLRTAVVVPAQVDGGAGDVREHDSAVVGDGHGRNLANLSVGGLGLAARDEAPWHGTPKQRVRQLDLVFLAFGNHADWKDAGNGGARGRLLSIDG